MNGTRSEAIVIGAGVIGLTTALCLAGAGFRVEVWTAENPGDTTSVAAGAMWGPYHAEPLDRVTAWSDRTLAVLQDLSREPSSGVRLVAGIEASRVPAGPPPWSLELHGFRMCAPHELPTGFSAAWRYTAPLVEMPVYINYLLHRFLETGGSLETRAISRLHEATTHADLVVNCAGMGARALVPDRALYPVRGQLVVVENPGITEFFSEETGSSPHLTHWYPFGDRLVLGGTAQPDIWDRQPDSTMAEAIIRRCSEIEPSLCSATILAHRVGLRPTRARVRVESHGRVIHNYGHGGAGVTLSWGCAEEVVALALRRR
ncbi:FAD-dependent oxidoreductase [Actinoplanes sp. HUAS TT8]|uniref:FAD-dependent oxidoreductase n=1 Tax=Actinoplanes sp. HUAS TT8 TaxID=3447453 RepID=UPI003F5224FE